MRTMNPAVATPVVGPQWQWHYRALSRLRDVLMHEREEREAALRSAANEPGGDFADIAEAQNERRELVAELAIEQAELAEVEAALDRIRRGSYGVCEATGQPISAERLHAVPWARFASPRLAATAMRA